MRNLLLFMLLAGIFMFGRSDFRHGIFNGFHFGGVKGTGPIKTELRAVSGFKSLSLNIAGDVEFSVSDHYSVEVQAQESLLPPLKTEVDGENLRISFDQNVHSSENILIKVSAPSFEGFDLAGSGNIRAMTPLKSEKLNLDISGSGNIVVAQADIADLHCDVSGSGGLELGGKAQKMSVQIDGSGAVDSRNLNAETLDAEVSGSGDIQCSVSQTLKAQVSGSGNIRYRGTPQVDAQVSGSGTVARE